MHGKKATDCDSVQRTGHCEQGRAAVHQRDGTVEGNPFTAQADESCGEEARTLGASGWQTFWRITLPSIRWAVIYGVILTTARCLGEYGAVAVVSGRIQGETETATLRVEERYDSFDLAGRLRDLDRARADRDLRAAPHDPRQAAVSATGAHVLRTAWSLPDACDRGALSLMSIHVRNVSKRFGDFTALDDVSLEVQGGSLTALARPERLGQVDPAAHHRGPRECRTPARSSSRGEDATDAQAAEARRRLRVPALRRVQAHDRP